MGNNSVVMITTNQFKQSYISRYEILESDFRRALRYVSLEEENYDTYSDYFLSLLLDIGSEVDVVIHKLAKMYDNNFNMQSSFQEAFEIVENNNSQIKSLTVTINRSDVSFIPWDSGNRTDTIWWTVYTKGKHHRAEKIKELASNNNDFASIFNVDKEWRQYANLKNVLNALMALFVLINITYKKLLDMNGEAISPPYIDTIFNLDNTFWNGKIIARNPQIVVSNVNIDTDDETLEIKSI